MASQFQQDFNSIYVIQLIQNVQEKCQKQIIRFEQQQDRDRKKIKKMLRQSSITAKTIMTARYLVNHKKPIVEMPSHKPPKYIYRVKYHPTATPTFDQQFRDHHHSNDFDDLAMNDMEIYRFRYSGQWWYIGNIIPKLLTIAFPFWIIYQVNTEAETRKSQGRQGQGSWENIPQFPSQSKISGIEY